MHATCGSARRGTTLVELLCALVVMTTVTTVTVARMQVRADVNRSRCAQQLKETALAFRLFANDNADRFPAQVSQTFGGAREAAAAGQIEAIFRPLADYQARPEDLVCPGDTRSAGVTFSNLAVTNISYFVNVNAKGSGSSEILFGDRDLIIANRSSEEANWGAGFQRLEAGQALEWSGTLHRRNGNLARVDGSAGPTAVTGLPETQTSSAQLLFPQ
jgi:hypothetical protein